MDAESVKKSILDDGFFFLKDQEFGRWADVFAAKGYPFQTEDGVDFLCAVLDNKLIRDTVESTLGRCGIGMFTVFGPHPDSTRALLNRTTDELLALNVLLCRSGSRIILDKGTHMLDLNAEPGKIGHLELPRKSLENIPDVTPVTKDIEDGGLVITDGRLFCTVLEGAAIGVGFAVEKELREWGIMLLPKLPNIEQKVSEMGTDKIRTNFYFVPVRR